MILASSGMTSTGCSCLFPPGNVYHMVYVGLSVAKQSKAHLIHTLFLVPAFPYVCGKTCTESACLVAQWDLEKAAFSMLLECYVCIHI